MEKAIKKAIEGGYYEQNAHMQHKGTSIAVCFPGTDRIDTYISKEEILLDPLFWQALGKAEGWDCDMKALKCGCSADIYYSHRFCPRCGCVLKSVEHWTTNWKKEWHRLIDQLVEGKDVDSFFNRLLK